MPALKAGPSSWRVAAFLAAALLHRPLVAVAGLPADLPPDGSPESTPASTTRFAAPVGVINVIGELQLVRTRERDTLIDIAVSHDLGVEQVIGANPGIDLWMPGEGTAVLLPARFVLPDAPREGIVVNVATRRLFYFVPPRADRTGVVYSFPVGIGREGTATPLGATRVVVKQSDPAWRVPASILRERAAAGEILPAVVPPGPANPLGRHLLRLGLPGDYLIHGSADAAAMGARVSHGCIRMRAGHIAWLYSQVPLGLPVRIVNQPVLVGITGDDLLLEAHPALAEDREEANPVSIGQLLEQRLAAAGFGPMVDAQRLAQVLVAGRGVPESIARRTTPDSPPRIVRNAASDRWWRERTPAD